MIRIPCMGLFFGTFQGKARSGAVTAVGSGNAGTKGAARGKASSTVKTPAKAKRPAAAKTPVKAKIPTKAKAPAKSPAKGATRTAALVLRPATAQTLAQKMRGTVQFIAAKDRSIGEALEDIGDHILQTYFQGDVKRAKSHNPIKGFSMTKLAQQKGMGMSLTSLRRCVDLAGKSSRK